MSRWAAVLAGGSGTRFWPLSTLSHPKQFLSLAGDRPLLAQAIARLEGLVPHERILVVTAQRLVEPTRRLLTMVPADNVLGEPRAASTAPALAWATATARARDAEAVVLSQHADWFVGDDAAFRETAACALDVAERHDVLVTVGITPTRPDPGYGYVEPGKPLGRDARHVARFVEKPDARRAAALIERGGLWNSGLFAWTATRFFAETAAVALELAPHVPLLDAGDVSGFFRAVTPVAVDVSHLERSRRIAVVPGRFRWDDVGTWAALSRVRPADGSGNVVVGDAVVREARDCVVWAADRTVVVDGGEDLVVVSANGVTLVTTRDRAADLKTLLEALPPGVRATPS